MPTHTPRLIAAATAILTLAVPALAHAVPKARYDYSPTTPTTGLSTSFDASRTSCDRKPCSFRWQDDGSDGAGGTNTTLGTGMRLAYTFMSPGRKDVRLTVTNARGQSGTTVQTVQVADAAPPPPPPPPPAACANGLDDDGDGLVDLGDPGCTSALDTDETNVVQSPPDRATTAASRTGCPPARTTSRSASGAPMT